MKLLYDATELSYFNDNSGYRAGVYNVALNLFNEFIKLGVDITFTCDYRRYYFLKEIEEFKNIKLLEEHSMINKFWGKLIYLTRNFPIRTKYAILILSRFYDAWFYKINKKNSEQLKNYSLYFSPFTPPNKEIEKSNLKKVRMVHDCIPIIERGMPKSPKDWYFKIYTTLNNNDFYISNSECTKRDIIKFFNINDEHIQTALLGVNERFRKVYNEPIDILKGKKYILSLCTIGKRKNLDFTIKNFFEFIKKNNINDLYLVLAGSIWKKFENELNNSLSNVDKEKVILTGYINDDDLPALYSNAMMFVFPSLYEGFGLPVLEAMACGCPVITSNTSSLPEVIGEVGIKVNPKDNKEMIEAFERMYYDNIFRSLCAEQGMERAKNYKWERCAKTILNCLCELQEISSKK